MSTSQEQVRIYKFPAHLMTEPVPRNSPRLELAPELARVLPAVDAFG